jgi:tricarballylate dehydrogenase
MKLLTDDSGVTGVVVKHRGKTKLLPARAVVLAAGGFQADPEQRVRYLGPGWELAKVRGTRFNTGDGIPVSGLYAAGELVGGIFYFNYPGGTGLTNGAVFGRIAGGNAAASCSDPAMTR